VGQIRWWDGVGVQGPDEDPNIKYPYRIQVHGKYAWVIENKTRVSGGALGYPASANHVLHYDGLMVPLAVDAGLGELGRLGYLITKEFGPRVRLGAVTTNLPLIADKPINFGVQDFCNICKKYTNNSCDSDCESDNKNSSQHWRYSFHMYL